MTIQSSASPRADRRIGARRQNAIDTGTPDAGAALSDLPRPGLDLAGAHSQHPVVMDRGIPLPQ
ncbi:hypothetical protein [Arthrobacter sp. NicSoilB8]|uniref:hypothetical protein n=1 Tax=Arthrobacter sp. NicSoilB8 TaxID=2830998 RepID=UPI001CC44005|nr:hypothetical protein [Arthrobacter sp. NicSoilB8]BCW69450.1 hypothetical protein NicSoilB8_04940 [Arthrobacter sp. NicSoilB8]